METQEYKGFTIRIEHDECVDDPREWDNLGTMVCWHNRYNLGDEQPKLTLGEWLSTMLSEFTLERYDKDGYVTEPYEDFDYDLENDYPDAINKALAILDTVLVMLPLYLYDHGNIAMSTSRGYPFNCPWDSGQVGFMYIAKSDIRKEYSRQRISKKLLERVLKVMRQEVETYSQYLQSDVWCYSIEHPNGILDNCGGLYGYDYCLAEAQSQIDFHLENS